jgi:spermidine/putrescine transport system permease protein
VSSATHLPPDAGTEHVAPPAEERSRRRWTPYWLLLPGMAWLVVFFAVPMVTLASTSVQTGSLEAGYEITWRWQNYTDALSTYYPHFLRSFLYAGIATVLALLLSYPLAYTIAFKAGRWKNLLLVLVIAPFFTSFLIRTLAWTSILADNGWVVQTLQTVGLLGADGRLLATPIAVVTGLTYNFLPFMTLPLYASLDRMDQRLVEAAEDLYASAFTAFRKVTFPLSLPGVVAGTLLTFIPASGDYINAELLGTPRQYMIGNVIDSQFLVRLDYPTAAALSFVLMAAILVVVIVYIRRAGTEDLV